MGDGSYVEALRKEMTKYEIAVVVDDARTNLSVASCHLHRPKRHSSCSLNNIQEPTYQQVAVVVEHGVIFHCLSQTGSCHVKASDTFEREIAMLKSNRCRVTLR